MATTSSRMHTRQELSAAALTLFSENGYESTTVDQIAAHAGVARRTFFRYFPAKDDAVLPDHDSTILKVTEVLKTATSDEDPIAVICRAIREVLRMYAADPDISRARYRLLRKVPALREREIAVVSRYERLFTKYLLSHDTIRMAGPASESAMLAEAAAAAVVAAHNHVLRQWLRTDDSTDAITKLDHALSVIRERFATTAPDSTRDRGGVVVAYVPEGSSTEDVMSAVRRALN